MSTKNSTSEGRKLPAVSTILSTGLDVLLIAAGAMGAAHLTAGRYTEVRVNQDFIAFSIALALVLFPSFKIYQSWRGRSLIGLMGQMALAWVTVQACNLVLMFLLHRTTEFSGTWIAYWTGSTGAMLIFSRLVARTVLGHIRKAGHDIRKVAVVGYGAHCRDVIRNIESATESGFRATAALDLRPISRQSGMTLPIFHEFKEFSQYVRNEGVQELWLALPLFEESSIRLIVDEFSDNLVNIRFIPDVSGLALFETGVTDLIGLPAINLIASPLSSQEVITKEVFDRAFAACALIALSPLLLAIAVIVKLSSPGPVFFRQRRKGADGRTFQIYKFRTMYVHKEDTGVVKQATRGDSRITRVGVFLRSTSLDELPQFLNVLRGEMSVVGPRPHAIEHDELYQKLVEGYIHRYRAKPGITGWAQINGYRGETDRIEKMQGRVEYDLYYLRNWSFSLDLLIVAKTIIKGFKSNNAY